MASTPDPARLAAWTHLVLAHSQIMRRLEAEMAAEPGIPLAQYDVLLTLSGAPRQRMRMSDLADAVLYSTGGLTRLLERMERADLITRTHSTTDRRVVYASLTDEGRRLFHAAAAVHVEGIQRHFGRFLPDDELEVVGGFLARLDTATRPGDTCAGDSASRGEVPAH